MKANPAWSCLAIPERNRLILQMRNEGVRRIEVARRFNLSPGRIEQIEKQDAVDKAPCG
jgi:DNA-directed RNA polymerase specialized sigma subunit